MKEKLSSRIGFLMLSAGCAIGIGNVWRFPYVVGQSGGGCFVPIYLLALGLLGVPVLAMEFAVGRAAQVSLAKAHATLTPDKRWWRLHGAVGLVGVTMLMMFYTTVAGWMVDYFVKTAAGVFVGMGPDRIAAEFRALLADPWTQIAYMGAVTAVSAGICGIGLVSGLERVTKWMMLALLILIVALAVNSALLDGSGKGLRFYLMPDFARMRAAGVANVVINAMNQAFFTLSLGIGAMAIFGSYIDRKRTLLGEAVNVALLDTVVAISAGLIIIPACFAYGIEPGQGPGLVFVTLPNVFNHMPGGRFWGALFFVFMSFAALSTVLTVFEAIIAGLRDYFGWSRRKACVVTGVGVAVLSLPCVLGFNVWAAFEPLGKGTNVLDLEDFIVSDLLLPAGALVFAGYCCHRFGWGWKNFIAEVNAGEGVRLPNALRWYCGYVIPVIVLLILVLAVARRFA